MSKLSKRKFDFKTDPIVKLLIALITAILITFMFPRSESIEADYSVGSVWSKEDLIAPFSFPIYKSEQLYQREVNEAKNKVLPLFDVNPSKGSGQNNWLDALNRIFNELKKITDYENDLNKESVLPEEKRTTSLQTLSKMKSDFRINLNSEEWKGLISIYLNPSNPSITGETFRKKIIQTLN